MKNIQQSLMQQALGKQWEDLPAALQAHYNNDETGKNIARGELSISYPKFMQIPLTVLRTMGALVNQQGEHLPTTVERFMQGDQQFWHRTIHFPTAAKTKQIHFKSLFTYDPKKNIFIEYTSPFLGLKMKVHVENNQLHYESCGYQLKLFGLRIPIPEYLALGHAHIIESAVTNKNDRCFAMDFRLKHPLLGEIFSYEGKFETKIETK